MNRPDSDADAPRLFPQPRLLDVSEYLRRHQGEWRSLGVSRVQVFGSVARNEAQEGSDVDVLVEFAAPAGLLTQVRAIWLFEALLGRRTDVVTRAALKSLLVQTVLQGAVDVMDASVAPATLPEPSSRRWRWRVQELIGTLDRLAALVQGLTEAGFQADQTMQDAVCMNLLRLGEGTKFVPERVQDAHPELPWAELRAMRNLVAHDYFGLDLRLIWQTLVAELPPLRAPLEAVLDGQELEDVA